MKKYFLTILIFLNINAFVYSQGFDWQYSPRLPFEIPNIFIGVDATGGFVSNKSDFRICNSGIPCDTFEIGTGISYTAGIKIEYWGSEDLAYYSNLSFAFKQNSYLNENLYYYFPDVGTKILEFEYLRTEYIPEIEIGAKYRMRFLLPHLFTSLSIKLGFVTNSSEELILKKISKADWLEDEIHFSGFDPLELSRFIIEPHLKVGYDLNLGLGKFTSFYLDVSLPIQNRYNSGGWYSTTVSAGISVFPLGF